MNSGGDQKCISPTMKEAKGLTFWELPVYLVPGFCVLIFPSYSRKVHLPEIKKTLYLTFNNFFLEFTQGNAWLCMRHISIILSVFLKQQLPELKN